MAGRPLTPATKRGVPAIPAVGTAGSTISPRATRLLIDILDKIEPRREAPPTDFAAEDEKVIANLLARLGRAR